MRTDWTATARSHSATAAAQTRRAARDARDAERFYQMAASIRKHQTWIVAGGFGRYDDPAELDRTIASWVKTGDVMLRASFHATARAASYRAMAASARANAIKYN